jgi:hypothetical protein
VVSLDRYGAHGLRRLLLFVSDVDFGSDWWVRGEGKVPIAVLPSRDSVGRTLVGYEVCIDI